MNIRIPLKATPVTSKARITTEPLTIVATQPKGLKDAWAVLRGHYEVKLTEQRPMDMAAFNDTLKEIWTDPFLSKMQGPHVERTHHDEEPRRFGLGRRWTR